MLIAFAACAGSLVSCKKDNPTQEPEGYIVDGQNYGRGVTIGNLIWAPVNCGYDKDHPYGKLYQWGRKDGVELKGSGNEPTFSDDPVTPENAKPNIFYKQWSVKDNSLWASGGAGNPCPKGWRIPTKDEMDILHSLAGVENWVTEKGIQCYKISVGTEALFIQDAGYWRPDGSGMSGGEHNVSLWTATMEKGHTFRNLYFFQEKVFYEDSPANSFALSVRCVKDVK